MPSRSAYGAAATRMQIEWGHAADASVVGRAVRDGGDYAAVLVTHNETSTGVTNPLAEICTAIRAESDALILVDAVSSLGSIPLQTDAWGIDVVVTASQKGWLAPPGIAMASMSERALAASRRATMPRFYLDLPRHLEGLRNGQPPWTPALSILYGLDVALDLMAQEGRGAIFARHARIAQRARSGARALGLELFADERVASDTVTAVKVPPGIDGKALLKIAREEHDTVLGGGQGKLAGQIFRIGHLGWMEGTRYRQRPRRSAPRFAGAGAPRAPAPRSRVAGLPSGCAHSRCRPDSGRGDRDPQGRRRGRRAHPPHADGVARGRSQTTRRDRSQREPRHSRGGRGRRPPAGHRARGRGRGQHRHRVRNRARHRGGQRPHGQHRVGRGVDLGPPARRRAACAGGGRKPARRALEPGRLHGRRGPGEDGRDRWVGAGRIGGRAAIAGAGDDRHRLRPVRPGRAGARARRRTGEVAGSIAALRLREPARRPDARDHPPDRAGATRADETQRADHQRRPRRADRRGSAAGGAGRGAGSAAPLWTCFRRNRPQTARWRGIPTSW